MTRQSKQSVRQIRVDQLVGHELNRPADAEKLAEIAASIPEFGILQPLIVTEHPTEPDRWLILDGRHRAGAAKLAGRYAVPCVVRHNLDEDPDEQLLVMIAANCLRKEVGAIERAEWYAVLRRRGMKLTDIAARLGIGVSAISACMSLLDLDPETREQVRRGEVAAVHAKQAVVKVRQEVRKARGQKPNGRPHGPAPTEPAHFTRSHPLADAVRASCDHPLRPRIGDVGCGQCWETAIRADASQNKRGETKLRSVS